MVEYGSTPYMMFMLGEYVAIVLMCALTTILFLGGWLPPHRCWPCQLGARASSGSCSRPALAFFMFSMVKAFVPRYRYDQLMRLGWKVFLPISLGMVVIVAFSQADGNRAVILTTCFSIRLIKPSKSGD
jgi:NADH-quinone oxidoreductase subunit H